MGRGARARVVGAGHERHGDSEERGFFQGCVRERLGMARAWAGSARPGLGHREDLGSESEGRRGRTGDGGRWAAAPG